MRKLFFVLLLAGLLLSACGGGQAADGPQVTVYKPPT